MLLALVAVVVAAWALLRSAGEAVAGTQGPGAAPASAAGSARRGARPAAGRPLRVLESAIAGDRPGAELSVPEERDLAPGLDGIPFVPFHQKRGEFLGSVRLGFWPAERRAVRDPAYANPRGFYVVTEALRAHPVSPHFTLGEFAMRDGMRGAAGETYVALEPALLEKLERVLAELAARGVHGADLRILSAFRAPRYNAAVEGAAPSSRHQFGDAADVVVDGDGDGRMDDLTRDGRVDRADLHLVADAVERVERADAALVGGLGLYDAQGPSGPFLHVDVRGRAARWGSALRAAPADRPAPAPSRDAELGVPRRRPGCYAEGESAVLCLTRRELQRGR